MTRLIALVALLALGAGPAHSQAGGLVSARPDGQRPALMILGTAHLANPGADVQNAEVDDVLAPARQAEIEAVVEALARWGPTHVAVEVGAARQAELDRRYEDYRAGRHELSADEADQIGLRLAARLGLERVHAVDWNAMPPGEEADYNWIEGAEAAGEQGRLAAIRDPERSRRQTELVRANSIPAWLAVMNGPDHLAEAHAIYFDYALLGTPEAGQGANWVGAWYGRNLKIFANLVRLAERPDDRVLVVYGGGHAYLLNRFGVESRAFDVESPLPALLEAQRTVNEAE